MSLTHEKSLEEYRNAIDELREVVDADDSTDEQMEQARDVANKLSNEYADSHIASIEARTEQYRNFIAYMENVIADLESAGPLDVINNLKSGISIAKDFLSDD